MNDRNIYWRGQLLGPAELYAKGVDDEHQRSMKQNRASVQGVADEIKRMILSQSSTRTTVEQPASWWPQFTRAAEHIVYDVTGAPTGSGEYQGTPDMVATLSETWVTDAMPVLLYTRLVEAVQGQPIPLVPSMATVPTAGPRSGEKQSVYSKAFDIQPATTTDIDAGLYLNISQMVIEQGFGPLTNTIMKAAVAAEASKQVAQAVEAAAGAGGMGNFTGSRYVPKVVVVPPSEVATVNAANFVAAGMTVVIDTQVTKTLIVDPNAVIGWFRQGRIEQAEPSVEGTGVAVVAYGKLAVDPDGVAALTATP